MAGVAKSPRRTAARKLQDSYKELIERTTAAIKQSDESKFEELIKRAELEWIQITENTRKTWKNVNPDRSLARTDLTRIASREVYQRARVGPITEDKLIRIGFKKVQSIGGEQYEYQATNETPKVTIIKSPGSWIMTAGIPGEVLPKSGRVQDRKKGAFLSDGHTLAWNIDERKLDMTVISGMTIIMSKLDNGWSSDIQRLVANVALATLDGEVKRKQITILLSVIAAEAIAIAYLILQ